MAPKKNKKASHYVTRPKTELELELDEVVLSVKQNAGFLVFSAEPIIYHYDITSIDTVNHPSVDPNIADYSDKLDDSDETNIKLHGCTPDGNFNLGQDSDMYMSALTIKHITHHLIDKTPSMIHFPLILGNELCSAGAWSSNTGYVFQNRKCMVYTTFEDSEDTHMLCLMMLRSQERTLLCFVLWTLDRTSNIVPSMAIGCFGWFLAQTHLKYIVEIVP